ncbi:hypothetical protein NF681_00185 (plasmid) [Comamonadaceae bacterium OTU4NAUVB1]|nr:hypothetical protein NF681_00185 [Comamonadaceae bacterium OTU4NAUVB1]
MIKLPTAFQVSDCVRRLTRRDATVTVLAKPATAKLAFAGTFHSGDGLLVAMCAADLALAAYTGAALALIPADSAQERVRSGALDEMMQENFAEVLNVLSRIFVVPETTRMALLEPIFPPRAVPEMLELGVPGTSILRADYAIDIGGYGVGHLALWGMA